MVLVANLVGGQWGQSQPISPRIRFQSQVDCYGLGAHVCVAVAFLVMQWIPIVIQFPPKMDENWLRYELLK